MTMLIDVSLSLELSTLIISLILFLALGLVLIISLIKKRKIEVDCMDIGLTGLIFHISNDKSVRQIAFKIWVEINTRVIGVKIDLGNDIIRSIHESYYSFFKATRLLIEDIPAGKIKDSSELITLTIAFLNEVMRPYLTKWGVRFNEWYDSLDKNGSSLSPQELQKTFNRYEELTGDLLELNSKVINYSNKLESIAFSKKQKK